MTERPPITPAMQTAAFLMAHRALLVFLVRKIEELDPREATPAARDATADMLRNSMPRLFAGQPAAVRDLMVEMARAEIDRILTAPDLPAHPEDQR
jgi:hypothetical protein